MKYTIWIYCQYEKLANDKDIILIYLPVLSQKNKEYAVIMLFLLPNSNNKLN